MYQSYKEGWVEVICGCMFAGKTEELIRSKIAEMKNAIKQFQPTLDGKEK